MTIYRLRETHNSIVCSDHIPYVSFGRYHSFRTSSGHIFRARAERGTGGPKSETLPTVVVKPRRIVRGRSTSCQAVAETGRKGRWV